MLKKIPSNAEKFGREGPEARGFNMNISETSCELELVL